MLASRPLPNLIMAVSLLLMGFATPSGRAAVPASQIPSGSPHPPAEFYQQSQPDPLSSQDLNLLPLKAVLLVGPIDGDAGTATLAEVANMERAASFLEDHGVSVYRFYPGSGTFAEIEQAADGAQFLLYRGHGVYDGNLPTPNVGGFMLSSGYYSPQRIRENLHLAQNAILMLYGCFTAGSSSAEGDQYDIGIQEANRRVAQYSGPFFDNGAAGYYANWFGNAFESFLSYLFAGQTLGQTYESYFDFNAKTVYRTSHPEHTDLAMWVDKDDWDYWQYNNAFVGLPDLTLQDLFRPVALGGIPEELSFTVNVTETVSLKPETYTLTPLNIGGQTPISWTLQTEGDWFEVDKLQGVTPESFIISLAGVDTARPAEYSGTVTVTAIAPADTQFPVQSIDLWLRVEAPELGQLPEDVSFIYSIPDGKFVRNWVTLNLVNRGSSYPLDWRISSDCSWLNAWPTSGQTPQSSILSAYGFDTTSAAIYSGSITVTVTYPASVYNSPQVIPLSLQVIDRPFTHIWLPLVQH